MVKIAIKAETFNELLEMIGEYFHFNRGVNLVGGPFKCKIKGKWFYCQKITILVK
jgi:hypothetical protein